MAFTPPNMTFTPQPSKRIAGQARSHAMPQGGAWERACPAMLLNVR